MFGLKKNMTLLVNPLQLAVLMQPLLTALVIIATAQRTSTEKVFAFPEFDYAESSKNVTCLTILCNIF